MENTSSLPQSDRSTSTAAGYWVLARAGKRVLRPGGLKLTKRMLSAANMQGKKIVEFAPGLGPAAVARVEAIVKPHGGTVINAKAQETGLSSESAEVVVGEAMLTMQGEKAKAEIAAEAFRLLKPGGRYAIHELGLTPNDIDPELADGLRKQLARTIRANARPLTENEWRAVLTNAGFEVEWRGFAPMASLSLRRNLADEGLLGVARIIRNLIRDKDLRARVLQMRSTFNKYRDHLTGIAIVAKKPSE